jgi:BlaI family transcriptional regulator, penicillinase repressor
MPSPRLSRSELKVMQVLWDHGAASVREIQEALPDERRPAYTTVQTMLYRLEAKDAVRRTKTTGGAHIFEAIVSRKAAQKKLIDELLELFGGRAQPLMSHLIESGKLNLEDVKEARKALRDVTGRKK